MLLVDHVNLIDNGDVTSLRGTGSIDYTVDNVFVAEEFTDFAVVVKARQGGRLYNIGIIGFAQLGHSGWASAEVANFGYLSGDTTALRRGTIQRLVRDVHAGTQHVSRRS